jgi:hypothetical protein
MRIKIIKCPQPICSFVCPAPCGPTAGNLKKKRQKKSTEFSFHFLNFLLFGVGLTITRGPRPPSHHKTNEACIRRIHRLTGSAPGLVPITCSAVDAGCCVGKKGIQIFDPGSFHRCVSHDHTIIHVLKVRIMMSKQLSHDSLLKFMKDE